MVTWLSLLLGCGGASSPNGVSATCVSACNEYIDAGDAEQEDACSDALSICYDACEEITAGATGACLACLADESIVGPDPYRTALPDDTGRNTGPYMCELGYIAGGECDESCP